MHGDINIYLSEIERGYVNMWHAVDKYHMCVQHECAPKYKQCMGSTAPDQTRLDGLV